MKLWHLERYDSDEPSYDESHGFVIRAANEEDARALAATKKGDEGADAWTDPKRSFCRPLPADGEPGIILRDFYSA